MLTLLMKSKFGERFDAETMFHPGLSDLINQLSLAAGCTRPEPGECFERADLFQIAGRVLEESVSNGWWSMAAGEKRTFLQRAASPWVLSNAQLDTILEDVEDQLFRHRQVVVAAESSAR